MNDQSPTHDERVASLKGLGSSRKRVEDARFTQGKGNYVDDIKMADMLFGDFVRSQYAHARIKSVDTSRAMALPGVVAVLQAADLAPLGLHWMPTLAGDKQMVLADGKVLFQGQEIAFVIAEDRYICADAIELIEVEYEELPVVVDPFKALLPGAPVLREDLAGQTSGAHGPRRHHNHIFLWEVGDKVATDQAIDASEVVAEEMVYYHRTHPCPLETCGCVASMDKINGKLTVWGNHSPTMYADYRFATVNGKSVKDTINDHDWNANVFLPTVGKRGAAIIEARGLSSAASAANAAIDHMRDWALGTNGKWVTMGIPSQGWYGIPKDVMFGFPVTCENGEYKVVEGLEIDAFSQGCIDKTLKELTDEQAGVAHLI